MAEIRMTREGGDLTLADDRTLTGLEGRAIRDPDHLLPEHAGAGVPGQIAATDDPDVARREIEATRARMSDTIDSIEEVLLRKKERLQERMDFMAPVRQRVDDRPLLVFGGVFAAGLLLGYLTGESDDDDDDGADVRELVQALRAGSVGVGVDVDSSLVDARVVEADGLWRDRARKWEKQSRRLMKERDRLEGELHLLRDQLGLHAPEEEEEDGGGWHRALAGAVGGVVSGLFHRGSRGEADVEFTPDPALEGDRAYAGGYEESRQPT
jgi:hypothetical protein